jgi:hypothetical protein
MNQVIGRDERGHCCNSSSDTVEILFVLMKDDLVITIKCKEKKQNGVLWSKLQPLPIKISVCNLLSPGHRNIFQLTGVAGARKNN